MWWQKKYSNINIYILPCINVGNLIQELCHSTNLTFMIVCLTYCGACITRSSCTLFILYKSCKHTCEALALNLLYSFKAHHSDIFITELNEILLLSIIYVSSCWERNVLIFLFISGNVISATEDIICSSPVVPVVSKMVASLGCCWGAPDFFAFEVCSLFLTGYGTILQYQYLRFTSDLFPSGLSPSEWDFCVVAFS